jgi:SAM-dependent MidA family methyltransferase
VVEAGAGAGTLARSVLDANPACRGALHYVLVERSPVLRAAQESALPLEPARQVLGAAATADPEEGAVPVPSTGPVVSSLAEMPSGRFTGVGFANELLDNLPFRLFERRGREWLEVRVGLDGEVLVPATPEDAATCGRLAPDAPDGGRIPLQERAVEWVRDALRLLERGRLVIVDYADSTPSMARRPWREWVRTYRAHGRGSAPVTDPGLQDVTCEVAVDQLALARSPSSDRPQATFLADHGLRQLSEQARARWQERAHIGDLENMKWRARLSEATTLADPSGLGAFRVLEWTV